MKKAIRRRLVLFLADWLPLINWLALIFFVSSMGGDKIPNLSKYSLDKVVHFVEYFILGWLMIRALMDSFPNMSLTKALVLTIILCALYAISDEWHQRFVPGRGSDFFDFVFDFIGASSAALAFTFFKEESKEHAKYKTF